MLIGYVYELPDCTRTNGWQRHIYTYTCGLEKPSVFDPRGQAVLTLSGKI